MNKQVQLDVFGQPSCRVHLSRNGSLHLPATFRRALNMQAGDLFIFHADEDGDLNATSMSSGRMKARR
ncbi:MAG: AbrB/MazE/SpoVT family DNA-binding domain-containing protein [Dehalococcoidia bacterium]